MFDPAAHRANSASLANKTVLITGATSGIGQATALAFARCGANVAIIGRDTGRGRRAIAACEGDHRLPAAAFQLLRRGDRGRQQQAHLLLAAARQAAGE